MDRAVAMRFTALPRPARCVSLRTGPRRTLTAQCCFMAASRSLALGNKCPYRTLGIGYDADEEAIKVAFRRKAKQLHPDVSRDRLAGLSFMECQHAYQTLLDPEKRAKYDQTLVPRANSQVLSYLNARSAARHGISITRVPSRSPYVERPELYSTMLELLEQVKSCAKHLEREVSSPKDCSRRRGLTSTVHGIPFPNATATAAAGGAVSAASSPAGSYGGGNLNGSKLVDMIEVVECEGDQECCEPWIYYAASQDEEEQQQQQQQQLRAAASAVPSLLRWL